MTKAISLYVDNTYKNSGNVKRIIDKINLITINPPADITARLATAAERRTWDREIDDHVRRKVIITRNL